MPYEITEDRRAEYRQTSVRSRLRKLRALRGDGPAPVHPINVPSLDPTALMPLQDRNGASSLSLFSGGGGLDLGFERAGFEHSAAYEVLEICGETLRRNRQKWKVFAGEAGDVRGVDWSSWRGIDIVHGGPPCQPFSIAGHRRGDQDDRNLWPEFVRCVLTVRPRAFVAENVPGILSPRFAEFVKKSVLAPLEGVYDVSTFALNASDFGVPQARKRVFFVGFRDSRDARRFVVPQPTHCGAREEHESGNLPSTLGAREALGLKPIGFDQVAPTLRSGFTGPRWSTSIVNSKASLKTWNKLEIWPNGVAHTREKARAFVPENQHFRLSVADCGIVQGFPESWVFAGAVYQVIGQIGNSVCPPVAYAVASAVAQAIQTKNRAG